MTEASGSTSNVLRRGLHDIATRAARRTVALFAWIVTSPRSFWNGVEPLPAPRVYFANHTSNGDFVLIWAALPVALRDRTRPVAAADYWLANPLRSFMGRDVFNAVLIDRRPDQRQHDPVTEMAAALDGGASLILFPEGRRNTSDDPLLPFKTGLYHLSRQRPEVDLVPVWIANLNNVLPRGQVIPVPLICSLIFGAPIRAGNEEPKEVFLARAAAALLALATPKSAGSEAS